MQVIARGKEIQVVYFGPGEAGLAVDYYGPLRPGNRELRYRIEVLGKAYKLREPYYVYGPVYAVQLSDGGSLIIPHDENEFGIITP